GHTVGHRADLGTHAAADACLVHHLVCSLRRDLEAFVGALQPTLGAFDARVEVDQRPTGTRAPLFVDGVARADLHRFDDDALAHLRPTRLDVFLVLERAAFTRLDWPHLDQVVRSLHGSNALLVVGALENDGQHRLDRDDVRCDARHRGKAVEIGAVVVIDPQPGKARRTFGRKHSGIHRAWHHHEGVTIWLYFDVLQQLVRIFV